MAKGGRQSCKWRASYGVAEDRASHGVSLRCHRRVGPGETSVSISVSDPFVPDDGALFETIYPALYRLAVAIAALALVSHLVIIGLGFALVVDGAALSRGLEVGTAPS